MSTHHFEVSFSVAKKLLAEQVFPLESEWVALEDSLYRILSESVSTPFDQPETNIAAMDGYAWNSQDFDFYQEKLQIPIAGEIYAGDSLKKFILKKHSYFVSTGAPLPKDFDRLIPLEKVSVKEKSIIIPPTEIKNTNHIQQKGSFIQKNQKICDFSTKVSSILLAVFSEFGIKKLKVRRKIKIAILTTGDELIASEVEKKIHQTFNSNAPLLKFHLQKAWIEITAVVHVSDHLKTIQKTLSELQKKTDIILMTGGVSVGKKDYTKTALTASGYHFLFEKVNIKPGKPFSCAIAESDTQKTIVFALPGNPGAVYSLLLTFIFPFLKSIAEQSQIDSSEIMPFSLTSYIANHSKLSLLLPVKQNILQKATLLSMNSRNILPFIDADGIVVVPPNFKQNQPEQQLLFFSKNLE